MQMATCPECGGDFPVRPSRIGKRICCSQRCRRAYDPTRSQSTVVPRFWAKVAKAGRDQCWLWFGAADHLGYGRLWANGRLTQTHRISYELAYGPIPDGRYVCHACDVPACVNPAHLWLGSAADNNRDAGNKGRSATGTRHGNAKFTEVQVQAIRLRYDAGGISQQALARDYGVSRSSIQGIVERKRWKHLPSH